LEGFELTSDSLKRGDAFVLLLYWKATTQVSKDYTVFVHLVDRNEKIVAGYDSQPRQGKFPTTFWKPKQLVIDPIVYIIPTDIPAGTYKLEIGLYDLATLERLLIVDPLGQPIADQVVIEPIDLR
jgi:hypothetical protein